MRLYLDTEFNGFGGDLISMALVGEDRYRPLSNHEQFSWYEACTFRGPIDPWVKEHVIPVLNKMPLASGFFRQYFHDWIRQFSNPEIICDWHADAEHFCRLLDGPNYGTSLDFACTIRILRTPPNAFVSSVPHNALADAIALRDWHRLQAAA